MILLWFSGMINLTTGIFALLMLSWKSFQKTRHLQCISQMEPLLNSSRIKASKWKLCEQTIMRLIQLNTYNLSDKFLFQYIRLHADIDVKNAIDLLLDQWTLPRPELLISIISDTKSKELDEKLSKHIANGLSQVNVAHVYL